MSVWLYWVTFALGVHWWSIRAVQVGGAQRPPLSVSPITGNAEKYEPLPQGHLFFDCRSFARTGASAWPPLLPPAPEPRNGREAIRLSFHGSLPASFHRPAAGSSSQPERKTKCHFNHCYVTKKPPLINNDGGGEERFPWKSLLHLLLFSHPHAKGWQRRRSLISPSGWAFAAPGAHISQVHKHWWLSEPAPPFGPGVSVSGPLWGGIWEAGASLEHSHDFHPPRVCSFIFHSSCLSSWAFFRFTSSSRGEFRPGRPPTRYRRQLPS